MTPKRVEAAKMRCVNLRHDGMHTIDLDVTTLTGGGCGAAPKAGFETPDVFKMWTAACARACECVPKAPA